MKGFDDFLPSHIIKLENILAWRTHSNIMYTEYAFLALRSQMMNEAEWDMKN